MTRLGIEPRSPGPLVNILLTRPMSCSNIVGPYSLFCAAVRKRFCFSLWVSLSRSYPCFSTWDFVSLSLEIFIKSLFLQFLFRSYCCSINLCAVSARCNSSIFILLYCSLGILVLVHQSYRQCWRFLSLSIFPWHISSWCRAASTDIPDPLSPFLPVVHCFWLVLRATFRILTELLYVCSCWPSCLRSAICGGPSEYITVELVPASPAMSCVSGSSNLDSFRDGRQVAV